MTTRSQIDAGTPAARYRDGWSAGRSDRQLLDDGSGVTNIETLLEAVPRSMSAQYRAGYSDGLTGLPMHYDEHDGRFAGDPDPEPTVVGADVWIDAPKDLVHRIGAARARMPYGGGMGTRQLVDHGHESTVRPDLSSPPKVNLSAVCDYLEELAERLADVAERDTRNETELSAIRSDLARLVGRLGIES